MLELREAFGFLETGRMVGDGGTRLTGVSTDTRRIGAGELFVALRGERFDAHDFAAQARAAGAAATVVERVPEGLAPPLLLVNDSKRALGEIGRGWRKRFKLPVIAVTGSNGKTTVKEMIASILAEQFGAEHRLATPGNLNNEIGVPLSVMKLRDSHKAAVLELGMNHIGEIAWLTEIARPTVALVNNAQREHQEFMASVEATARENGASIAGLSPNGIAVFPGDDEHAPIWRGLAGGRRCIDFGLDRNCQVNADAGSRPDGFEMRVGREAVQVTLSIDGTHNVRNALAAAACCDAIGIAPAVIARGLAAFRPVSGRLVRHALAGGGRLIDDSYNANPDSVRAAIDVLATCPAPRLLVLGDMGEVGERGPEFHREVGAYAAARGIERVLCHGEATRDTVAAFGAAGEHYGDIDALLVALRAPAAEGATVLDKGSRFMRMERVVRALTGQPAGAH